VKSVDAPNNLLTVVRADGSEKAYDPRRQQGVSVYRTEEKAFSVGDRIQFTAPANDLKVANRELGTVQSITDDGRIGLKMDGGRSVCIDPREHPHLDHGYAVTSHSSQSQTADRVLINIDTALGAKNLLNNRMAYVAVSRGAQDAQVFTNDRQQLPQALGRDVSHTSAHMPEMMQEQAARVTKREVVAKQEVVEPKRSAEPVEKIYTWAEHERHWTPLNKALTPAEADQFGWRAETGRIQSYRHNETGRHIHIDGQTGRFYDQDRHEVSVKAALNHAMPAGQAHSHSNDLKPDRSPQHSYGLGL